MFYDRFVSLCRARGVSPSRAALEAGISKSTVTKWKQVPNSKITAAVIQKLTQYFQITVSELLDDDIAEPDLTAIPAPLAGATFYERFCQLCRSRFVSPSRAAIDAGLSKSTVTKWKQEPDARPTGVVIQKLTEYFDISVSELLGESPAAVHEVTDEDIKFALFGGSGEITDEMYEEVRNFAAFVKQREAKKKTEN